MSSNLYETPTNDYAEAEQTVRSDEGMQRPLLQVISTGDLRPGQRYEVTDNQKEHIALDLRQNVFTPGIALNPTFRKVNTVLTSIPTPIQQEPPIDLVVKLQGYENSTLITELINRALGENSPILSGESLKNLVRKYPSPIMLEGELVSGFSADEVGDESKKAARVLMSTVYGARYLATKQLEHIANAAPGYKPREIL